MNSKLGSRSISPRGERVKLFYVVRSRANLQERVLVGIFVS